MWWKCFAFPPHIFIIKIKLIFLAKYIHRVEYELIKTICRLQSFGFSNISHASIKGLYWVCGIFQLSDFSRIFHLKKSLIKSLIVLNFKCKNIFSQNIFRKIFGKFYKVFCLRMLWKFKNIFNIGVF